VNSKIFVLIPVFNRLQHTREIIDCLRRQTGVSIQIVIVDDGSTDGTAEFLAGQADVMRLEGNGQLWWAGAIHLALRTIHPLLRPGDFFVFVNNDTKVDDDFLSVLAATSQIHGRAVVGSIVRDAKPPHELLDIGPKGDLWNMAIWDIVRDLPADERAQPREVYEVDFLPGRGTLYPGEVLDRIGYMRPRLLPHYHADYEFADRARRAGFPLLVASAAVTYSTDAFGNQRKVASFWRRKFGKGSPDNTLQKVAFFCLVGSPAQRLSAIPRLLTAQVNRALHPVKVRAFWIVRRSISTSVHILLRRRRHALLCDRLLRLLAAASPSSAVRARLLAARHVYASASLTELRRGGVLLLGPDASRHLAFFRPLRVSAELLPATGALPAKAAGADLVFCAAGGGKVDEPLPMSDALVQLARPGGILCCVNNTAQAPDDLMRLVEELARMPELKILADTLTNPSVARGFVPLTAAGAFDGARPVGGKTVPPHFFAAVRLR
jgi:GT2 family glycosyltransferase